MFSIIGIVVVFAAVIMGYLMEHGNLGVLIQPAEFVIIFGASIGSLLISSPSGVLKLIIKNLGKILASGEVKKKDYLELLLLLNQIFYKARKEGLIVLEKDVENPEKSDLFSRPEGVASTPVIQNFICDTLRIMIITSMPPHELDSLIDLDIEARNHENLIPSLSIAKVADSLPGLGIVAAVLGVVLTMGKISEPPEVLGHSIGAALVGTFLGVLACYGFVGPMASNLEHKAKGKEILFNVIKTALTSFMGGVAPQIAIESGRRVIPSSERPSFIEVEGAIREWKSSTK